MCNYKSNELPIRYYSCLQFHFTKKRLHKKNFLSWIAKNRDFLMKNQHFPQNERLRFYKKNWFQTKDALTPKSIAYVW